MPTILPADVAVPVQSLEAYEVWVNVVTPLTVTAESTKEMMALLLSVSAMHTPNGR
jgi:hypothetical protein